MTSSIRETTSAIAAGDRKAFAAFYEQWFDFVFNEARRYGRNDEQFCLDLVQETMMRVIKHMKALNDETSLQKWLSVVVKTSCYDQWRSQKRRTKRERTSHECKTLSQEAHQILDDRLEWLRSQLQLVDAGDAHLLSLRFRCGWTLQRIGRALGLKTGAVDGRITRAVAALQAQAEKDFHE